MKSGTPETDAFIESLNDDLALVTEHACKLECERNEARKEAEGIRDISLTWPDQRNRKFPWEKDAP